MNNEPIEAEHKRYKEFIQKHNLKVGSKIKIKEQGHVEETIKEVTIAYINSYYGWFGTNERPIRLEDVVFDEPEVNHETIGSD